MKITVITPSRHRVRGLEAILYSLRYLESQENEVQYGVICDNDDLETVAACEKLQKIMPLAYRVGERFVTMGSAINDMAKFMPADVYLVLNDDILCLSTNWDKEIVQAVNKTPHGVFWWTNDYDYDALYPIVTEKWRQAADGVFAENFPFWYDDLCLAELWVMTTDQEPIRLSIKIADKPVATQRMRELKFWQKVYTETRKLRVRQSVEIAKKLGLPEPQCGAELAKRLTAALVAMDDERLSQIEKNQGDTTHPDSNYQIAKQNAEKLLQYIETLEAA